LIQSRHARPLDLEFRNHLARCSHFGFPLYLTRSFATLLVFSSVPREYRCVVDAFLCVAWCRTSSIAAPASVL